MVFRDKLMLLKVCIWSGHTCSHIFSMHCFKNALSKQHLDARVISLATTKLVFTAASLLAVALVNKFCCNGSLPFNSWVIFCFSLAYQCSVQVSNSDSHLLCFSHVSLLKACFLKGYSGVNLIHGLTHCDPPPERSSFPTSSLCSLSILRKGASCCRRVVSCVVFSVNIWLSYQMFDALNVLGPCLYCC